MYVLMYCMYARMYVCMYVRYVRMHACMLFYVCLVRYECTYVMITYDCFVLSVVVCPYVSRCVILFMNLRICVLRMYARM